MTIVYALIAVAGIVFVIWGAKRRMHKDTLFSAGAKIFGSGPLANDFRALQADDAAVRGSGTALIVLGVVLCLVGLALLLFW